MIDLERWRKPAGGCREIRQAGQISELRRQAAVLRRVPSPRVRMLMKKARHRRVPAFDRIPVARLARLKKWNVERHIQRKEPAYDSQIGGGSRPFHLKIINPNTPIAKNKLMNLPIRFSKGVSNFS